MDLLKYIQDDKFPPEDQDGNIEYKCFLNSVTQEKLNKLVTQMKWRLLQGLEKYNQKIAYYVVGVYDDGTFANTDIHKADKSIQILEQVSKKCNFKIEKIFIYKYYQRLIHVLTIVSEDEDEFYPTI
jgi:GTPase